MIGRVKDHFKGYLKFITDKALEKFTTDHGSYFPFNLLILLLYLKNRLHYLQMLSGNQDLVTGSVKKEYQNLKNS